MSSQPRIIAALGTGSQLILLDRLMLLEEFRQFFLGLLSRTFVIRYLDQCVFQGRVYLWRKSSEAFTQHLSGLVVSLSNRIEPGPNQIDRRRLASECVELLQGPIRIRGIPQLLVRRHERRKRSR